MGLIRRIAESRRMSWNRRFSYNDLPSEDGRLTAIPSTRLVRNPVRVRDRILSTAFDLTADVTPAHLCEIAADMSLPMECLE